MPLFPLHPETIDRLAEWQADPAVSGALLVGSKSCGFADARSDDDLEIILTPEAFRRLSPAECHEYLRLDGASPPLRYDALLISLDGLRHKAESPLDIDHWPYQRARVLFDRTGEVRERVRDAALMPEAFRRPRIVHAAVDLWVAAVRAAKTSSRGCSSASRLVVVRGIKALARILFALEGRWVPPDHWLEAELPSLEDPDAAVSCLEQALRELAPAPLVEALERLERALVPFGFPLEKAERNAILLGLVHETRQDERAIHARP